MSSDDIQNRRAEFFGTLFRQAPRSIQEDHQLLCNAWRVASDAVVVVLWLYNDKSEFFEPSSIAGRNIEDKDRAAKVAAKLRSFPGKPSIAAYCRATGQCELVDDAKRWKETFQGREYSVQTADDWDKIGLQAFDLVPLLLPEEPGAMAADRCLGMISLHYGVSPPPRVLTDKNVLMEMGRFSALRTNSSQMAELLGMLSSLNKLTETYIRQSSRRPHEVRADYLDDLIKLVQATLNVDGVSVFYRARFGEYVECIGSTGLQSAEGERVPRSRLHEIRYRPNEGLVGYCYERGTEINTLFPEKKRLELKVRRPSDMLRETRSLLNEQREVADTESSEDPTLVFPILPSGLNDTFARRAVGVIRCTEHSSRISHKVLCGFDSVEERKLRFIAQQIGPVLQSFAHLIERESTISVIRHDLKSPYVMLRRVGDVMMATSQRGGAVDRSHILRVQLAGRLLANITEPLDPSPGVSIRVRPKRTHLWNDVLGPIHDMLDYYASTQNIMSVEVSDLESLPAMRVDQELVERILCNVIFNAVQYGESGTPVRVRAATGDADNYLIHIENDGIGVADEDAERIFEQGYRALKTRDHHGGKGLGLTTARRLMRTHGGDVQVTSRRGPTVFTLYFPKYLALQEEE